MTHPTTSFPPRRRRPSPTSFLSPHLPPLSLLHALHSLSAVISTLHPPPTTTVLRRPTISLLRKTRLLSLILSDVKTHHPHSLSSSPSLTLCLEEMYILLQRIKALVEDCSNGSKTWLLMQAEPYSFSFHELSMDLLTLLEVLPINELSLSDDVVEVWALLIKQCQEYKSLTSSTGAVIDENDALVRGELVHLLEMIEKEIVPTQERIGRLFTQLGLNDSASCRHEIECLEEEVQCLSNDDERARSEILSLVGLVRYGKCVLYGASSPRLISGCNNYSNSEGVKRSMSSDLTVPTDFRCPITLELMSDPVVVSTGQTYDRASISMWIESGHNTCPKTGQSLAHTGLIPNKALRSLIAMWCREQKVPYVVNGDGGEGERGGGSSKAALEATKMTASFLLGKLVTGTLGVEDVNRVVYELRVLAKTDSESRACIGEAGAIPVLVRYLGPEHPSLQVNAVTTMLNLSILEANKGRIMDTDGALNGVIEVLRSGATWEAKGNAAATIFSLSGIGVYRKRLGKKTRVIKGLLELAKDGPTSPRKDALVAIMTLAGDRETAGRLVEGGVVDVIKDVMDELPDEAMSILETVVKKGGFVAVAAASHMIGKLVALLRNGTDRTKESAMATLVIICRKGGAEMVSELAKISTIEIVIWELMGTGTARAKRKAASLMRILRRWAAGLEGDVLEEFSMTMALQ